MQHARQQKRRTDFTKGAVYDQLQRWTKQRTSTDTGRPLKREKEYVRSIGSNTKCKDKENTALLPPPASTVEIWTDRPALSVSRQDGEDEIISKLTAILNAVRAGKNIAETTTDFAAADQRRNPEMIARSQMSPQEYEAWTTFNDRLWHLPEIDWDNNQLPPHISLRSRKIARRRAEALNRLYKTDRAHEGHVTWITQNKLEFLPLIKAMARLIGAERNQVGGGEWHATQLTEIQSVNRILSIIAQIRQESESKLLRSKCAETKHVLGKYRRTLQAMRLRKSASIPASEKGTDESSKRESDDSQGRLPRQYEVEKVFPRCNQLRLRRLVKRVVFNCDRCSGQKSSKLVAFAQDQYDKPVCNGCYGNLCSRDKTK